MPAAPTKGPSASGSSDGILQSIPAPRLPVEAIPFGPSDRARGFVARLSSGVVAIEVSAPTCRANERSSAQPARLAQRSSAWVDTSKPSPPGRTVALNGVDASESLRGSPVQQLQALGVQISARRDVWEARLHAVVPRESLAPALELLGSTLPRWLDDPVSEEPVAELDPRLRGRVEELLRDALEVTEQGSVETTPRTESSDNAGAVRVAVAGDVDVDQVNTWMSSLNRELGTRPGCGSSQTSLGLPSQKVVWSLRDDAPAAGMIVWVIHGVEKDASWSRWRTLERWFAAGPGSPAGLFLSDRPERTFEPWFRAIGSDAIFGIYFETAVGEASLCRRFVSSALTAAAETPREAGLIRARHGRWMEEALASEDPELLASLLSRGEFPGAVVSEESGAGSIADETLELKAAAEELLSREPLIVGRGSAEDGRRLALPEPKAAPLAEPATPQPWVERPKLTDPRAGQLDHAREPVVAVSLRFRMGSAYEKPDQSGFSELLLKSIRLGAGGRTPEELERALWDAGCTLDERLDEQSGGLVLLCSRGGLQAGLSLMLTMVAEPDFPEPELSELVLRWGAEQREAGVRAGLEPAAPLRRLFLDLVEPRGSLPAPSADELKRFHDQIMVRKNLAVGLAGTFTVSEEGEISRRITAELSRLHEGASAQLRDRASEAQPVSFEPIRMDVETARIAWGHRGPPKGHPDEPAVALLVDVLAGPGVTRLRESLKDVGDLRGQYLRHSTRGVVLLEGSAFGGKAALLQKRMALELDRYRREGPSLAELNRSVARLRGQTSDRIASVADRADFRASVNLDSRTESTWLESLRAQTAEQVRSAAAVYLPEKLESSAILPRQD